MTSTASDIASIVQNVRLICKPPLLEITLDLNNPTTTLMIIIVGWIIFYIIAKALKFEEKGWVIQPYFALYKSTRLNNLIKRLAQMSPKTWKIVGNIGIAASIGQVLFLSWILISNLWNLVYVPEQATPVQPLIPGVTISYTVYHGS